MTSDRRRIDTIPYRWPEAKNSPSGVNDTCSMPVVSSVKTIVLEALSVLHNRTIPFSEPVATYFPSGEKQALQSAHFEIGRAHV